MKNDLGKSLLVIGGSGFFGKSILDAFQRGLLAPWHITKVIAMARSPEKLRQEAPELLSDAVELYAGDIATTDTLPMADYVIHAAASTDASKYLTQNEQEKQNIIAGTLNYCKLAPRFHNESKIVYCSSGAVYGYQPPEVEFLTEEMAFGNIEQLPDVKKAYAYAKRDSEHAIQQLSELGLNTSIARCFAFYGKYLPKDQHFAIGNFLADAEAGRPIHVKADKLVYRSYMHADDLVIWLMTLAENANIDCHIYNVGSDEAVELHDLARSIAKQYGVEVIEAPYDTNKVDRYVPSINKANSCLNFTKLKSMVGEFI